MVTASMQADSRVISLFPNRSATWPETRRLIVFIALTCLLIGFSWTLRGAWMILPFAFLEAGLVAWLLYRVSRNTHQRQVITLNDGDVTIEQGIGFPQRRWVLDRSRAHLSVTEPEHPLDGIRIRLFDPAYSVEIGSFLNAADRREALACLREAGLDVRGHHLTGISDF